MIVEYSLNVIELYALGARYDAQVFLDKSFLTQDEQKEALKQLKVVSRYLSNYIKNSEGWFKAPKFSFEFDDQLEKVSHIEELFKKISKERDSGDR